MRNFFRSRKTLHHKIFKKNFRCKKYWNSFKFFCKKNSRVPELFKPENSRLVTEEILQKSRDIHQLHKTASLRRDTRYFVPDHEPKNPLYYSADPDLQKYLSRVGDPAKSLDPSRVRYPSQVLDPVKSPDLSTGQIPGGFQKEGHCKTLEIHPDVLRRISGTLLQKGHSFRSVPAPLNPESDLPTKCGY
jgi:hypothetical protein